MSDVNQPEDNNAPLEAGRRKEKLLAAVSGKSRRVRKAEVEPDIISRDGKPLYRLNRVPPQALVVHCGDPRFQEAFRRFITEELGIRSYAPIIIGGGVHALGMQSFLPKNFKILWEQIKFFVKAQKLTEVIIINHEDCMWYEKMKGYHPRIDKLLKGKLDVLSAAKVILSDFPLVEVRAFWAGLDGETITFTELTDNPPW